VPEFYKLQYKLPDITSKLRYNRKLYHNELHVIARTSIKSIFDLDGKKIVAPIDVGYYAAKVIFSRLNIKPASFDILTDDARSIQKIADGEADAYITSTGKVFPLARNLIKNEIDRCIWCRFPMIAGCGIFTCRRRCLPRKSKPAVARRDDRHGCGKPAAGDLRLAGELGSL